MLTKQLNVQLVVPPPRSIITRTLVVIATAVQTWPPPGDADRPLSSANQAIRGEWGSLRASGPPSGDSQGPILTLRHWNVVVPRSLRDLGSNAGSKGAGCVTLGKSPHRPEPVSSFVSWGASGCDDCAGMRTEGLAHSGAWLDTSGTFPLTSSRWTDKKWEMLNWRDLFIISIMIIINLGGAFVARQPS